MNKSMSLRNYSILKKRRRIKKIRKQTNYLNKTHKGVEPFTLRENLKRKEREDLKEKNKMKELGVKLGLKECEKMNKYTTVELIEYLTNIGFMTDFDTEEDTHKLAEIQGRLLELDKINFGCPKEEVIK